MKKDDKSHIFKHLHYTATCFDWYKSLSFKIIDKKALQINYWKPNLSKQQNNLALKFSL